MDLTVPGGAQPVQHHLLALNKSLDAVLLLDGWDEQFRGTGACTTDEEDPMDADTGAEETWRTDLAEASRPLDALQARVDNDTWTPFARSLLVRATTMAETRTAYAGALDLLRRGPQGVPSRTSPDPRRFADNATWEGCVRSAHARLAARHTRVVFAVEPLAPATDVDATTVCHAAPIPEGAPAEAVRASWAARRRDLAERAERLRADGIPVVLTDDVIRPGEPIRRDVCGGGDVRTYDRVAARLVAALSLQWPEPLAH